jgi:hypothetical protein
VKLKIADDLNLPMAAVTEVLGFLGRRGQGKSYAAQKLAELMHEAGSQFVALDPVGIWWGLRLAADGKGTGIPLPVFGGLHGDVPLEPSAGKLIADVVSDRGISAVLDVSHFESDADKARFATDFGARFYFRRKQAPAAVHLFLEECQEFVPQNPQREETRTLHVYQRIAKLGRNYGIGVSLISQRPQEVHKKVLNLTELLFAFQLTGPHERKAVAGWIQEKGIDEDIDAELPKLKIGEPHAWSPAWLNISRVVHIGQKWTFDASSTPTGKAAAARELAPIDLEKLRKDMAATIEKAKADDPRELRKQIAELKKQLGSKLDSTAIQLAAPNTVEKSVLTDKDRQVLSNWTERLTALSASLVADTEKIADEVRRKVAAAVNVATAEMIALLTKTEQEAEKPLRTAQVQRVLEKLAAVEPQRDTHAPLTPRVGRQVPVSPHARRVPPVAGTDRPARVVASSNGDMRKGKFHAMLVALAQAGRPLSDTQLSARAVMALSGTFDKYLGQQRALGWVEGNRNALSITEAGLAALGPFDPLPTGVDLQGHWLDELGTGKKSEMLRALIEQHPKAVYDAELAELAGMALSGTFDKYLGQLRRLQLVEGPRTALKASDELFD